jgi:hypothetical protein
VTAAPVHVPLWHESGPVHALLSLQLVPFVLFVGAGQPLAGTHAPTILQGSVVVHVTADPPPQVPLDWQVSPVVQALLSLHVPPGAATQVPVVMEQVLQAPQAEPEFCHAPFASHTWGWDDLHCFVPGVQLPEHVPLVMLQRYWQAEPMFFQVPVASQT